MMGATETVGRNNLGKKVCQIFSEIDVRVNPDSLEASHGLKNKDKTMWSSCTKEIANK